jgi:hypothetical protein
MMRLVHVLGLLLLFAAPSAVRSAAADTDLPAVDRQAIRTVIEQQIAAFRHDDGVAAFAFAAPRIREQFVTPDNFMRMVREGYQPVYRPREVSFGALAITEGRLVQRVLLVGPDGVPVTALYFMEQQPDGSWKISGCVLTTSEDKST